jgi:hypothetical protein
MTKKLTPKQKQLVKLMPLVETGKMTMQDAMLQAGYSPSTAHQQSETLGKIRTNSVMQDALRKAGFDEGFLAETIKNDVQKLRPGQARKGYLELGSKLLDAMPAQKNLNADAPIEALLDEQESQTAHPDQ